MVFRPISRPSRRPHAHPQRGHQTGAHDGRRPLHDRGLEVAQLGRPDRVVDDHREHTVAHRRPAVRGPRRRRRPPRSSARRGHRARSRAAGRAPTRPRRAHRPTAPVRRRRSAPLTPPSWGVPPLMPPLRPRPASTRSRAVGATMPAARPPAVVTSVCPASRCATSATDRWSSSSLKTSSSSSTGELPMSSATQAVPSQPQRERERALLALRRVRATLEPTDEQTPLVPVRADQGEPPVDLGPPVGRERVEQRLVERGRRARRRPTRLRTTW